MNLLMNFLSKTCTITRKVHHHSYLRNLGTASSMKKSRPPTYHQLYLEWTLKFNDDMIPEPIESAGFIFAHLLGKKTFSLIPDATLHKTMEDSEISTISDLCEKRLQRMPIQYILGEWDFFGINLLMRPPVFIPRPETEELAEHVLCSIMRRLHEYESSKTERTLKVLEVGCGTGAITLSLFNKLKNERVMFVAIDAATHAVELTKDNLKSLELVNPGKVKVLHHKLERNDSFIKKLSPFDIIVSNPPYIPTADMKTLADEILNYEDKLALHGGVEGLDTIDDILNCASHMLTDKGSIWFEVDPSHPSLLSTNYDNWNVTSYRDMFGKDRFCHLDRRLSNG